MKYLYKINKWLIIINILLFIIPYFGLLFLIILGAVQVIMSVIIAFNFTQLAKNSKSQFILYSVITIIILIITKLTYNDRLYYNDTFFIIIMLTSIILAFLHLNITYSLYKPEHHENK